MSSNNIADIYFPISNKGYEVTFTLFTKCNLNCDFCFQNHSNEIDIEAIKNIPIILEDNYPEELKDPNLESIRVNITAGELFYDDIPDSMFDIYKEFFTKVIKIIRSYLPKIKFKVSWVSNGVNTKHDRIMNLFDYFNNDNVETFLGMSYDPVGRFKTNEQFKLFENTFWHFYNNYKIPPMMGLTLTKSNLKSFVNNGDTFLSSLPKNIEIDLCYYIANKNWIIDQPTDDDLYDFFIWSITNNIFQSDGLKDIIETIYNIKPQTTACVCRRAIGYFNGKFIKDCGVFSLPYERYFGNYTKDITPQNITEKKCIIGIEKRGCLLCEYKNICTGPCWCSMLFDEYKISECFLKRTIKYLYDHPEIQERYNNYKNEMMLL
jgi:sulfatase maturation enzyme AslB (radical SAM superfamily)